ncbi:MAG: 50S ribosomal protein L18 [Candidatus Gottesmanbacteria bacterium GW2011_GWB1_43_11]|uniref:Large ribosomal subunit protein uL18 n=1 Tax=Candidatus Gottesmanbacteria bacterium GW2011_GWB1_43_11 TaxID=1618446 RepID=A0A0G1FJ34_9BACT|nr:MAG: 50S ribosomal protein L18 [Candidatus Gottesmanbacteria bacterium GW2011_GWA2_42_16]KKS55751.1 MAG: 50S ribosomal protein L18 [Candidatus Gottesmanbacteria bacterium GW2011_GWA1_42_26]KKS81943.1 MAG: 50S ribosomal protein L18 [Candidatus Gottesmanbacteria bacterium GW2011_GWC1_43_10]KKS86863.1 MAG: 50S ribosomal protein L18 [Candidatus Gottesmanbacteria bacterium GW2011_GWB1_43_11]OGG10484.1 MAG: 50S ribosomal protein L18 [Candidatus Gottesmanbacteria bacterium RIFCSPHIGHO2_01_FULL_43_1
MVKHYSNTRIKRKARSRVKISGTQIRPRLAVFRSQHNLYVQLIDDTKRATLLGMSDKNLNRDIKNKIERAQNLGKVIGEMAGKQKITQVVFDRSGYTFHGRIAALAKGLKEGGLKF